MIEQPCPCAAQSDVAAPWLYMGPWHEPDCQWHGPMNPPAEELLTGETYGEGQMTAFPIDPLDWETIRGPKDDS